MTGFLVNCRGERFRLPALRAWDLQLGLGRPCDAFEVRFLYDRGSMERLLREAVRFEAVHEGKTVFTGLVDETCAAADREGLTARVSGRGMQALLLDNEASSAVYYNAALPFILDRHAAPFGFVPPVLPELPRLGSFTVAAGSSHWTVLQSFLRAAHGPEPRVGPDGALLLHDPEGALRRIGGSDAVTAAQRRFDRYGVISSVLVRSRASGNVLEVTDAELPALGVRCSRVLSVPRGCTRADMESAARDQIRQARRELETGELSLPAAFAAFPADIVQLSGSPVLPDGRYRVRAARCRAGADGITTRLSLLPA